jgi:carboxypeptidase C (cathepsin A)
MMPSFFKRLFLFLFVLAVMFSSLNPGLTAQQRDRPRDPALVQASEQAPAQSAPAREKPAAPFADEIVSTTTHTMLNSYLRGELKYKSDTPYAISGNVRPWNFSNVQNQYPNTAETLRGAMAANQYLKVFVASGYYDGATPFFGSEYTFQQTDLGGELKDRVKFGYYEAGHMMYINKAAHNKLKADLTEFIRWAAMVEK